MPWIGPAVAVVSVSLTTVFFFANRKTKRLNHYTVFEQPLLHRNAAYKPGNVVVMVDDIVVKDPVTVVVRVVNSGRMEIKPDDYAEPIKIVLKTDALMSLDAQGGPSGFDRITLELAFEDDGDPGMVAAITLPKVLLNPGEYIDVTLLVDSADAVLYDVHGRIAGARLYPGEPGAGKRLLIGVARESLVYAVPNISTVAGAAEPPVRKAVRALGKRR